MRPVQTIGDHAYDCARSWSAIQGMALHRLPRRGAAMISITLSQCNALHSSLPLRH